MSRKTEASVTPLDEARAAMLRAEYRGTRFPMVLMDEVYRAYRSHGISPRDLDRLVNILVRRGEARLKWDGRWVYVYFTEPTK